MTPKLLATLEEALTRLLEIAVEHPELGNLDDPQDPYGKAVNMGRNAIRVLRSWRALLRGAGAGENTAVELPGQQHIPGVEPCLPGKKENS